MDRDSVGRVRTSALPLQPVKRPPEAVVGLQRLAGNDAVSSLLAGVPTVQRVSDPAPSTLRPGDHGSRVMDLTQQVANLLHRDLGSAIITGDYGRDAEITVRFFQLSRNMNPDGIAGEDTMAQIERESGGAPAVASAVAEPYPRAHGTAE